VDVGMTYIASTGKELTPDESAQVRDVLTRYIGRVIPFHECRSIIFPILGTTQPIESLEAILCTSPMPLPSSVGKNVRSGGPDSRARAHLWTSYEDQRLLAGIHRFGIGNWQVISNFVGSDRTKSQCSQRWFRGLDPKISKAHWSYEQDTKLIELVAYYGDKSWSRIANEFGDRCDVQCRYRYKQLEKEPKFASRFELALVRVKEAPPPPPKVARPRVKPLVHLTPQISGFWSPPMMPLISQNCFIQGMSLAVPNISGLGVPLGQSQSPAMPSTLEKQQSLEMPSCASPFDMATPVGVSASGSFFSTFGISPANSFNGLKFDN
jgi:hypothetical protein